VTEAPCGALKGLLDVGGAREPATILFVDDDRAGVDGAVAAGQLPLPFDDTDPAGSFGRVRRRLGP
jgi:hypothetical protein